MSDITDVVLCDSKLHHIPKDVLTGKADDITKQEFIDFVKKAINPRNEEHKELYHFLVRTFQAGDVSGYGEVGPAEFDEMIECAAAAPRRFGLAPKTEDMFKSKGVRFRYHIYQKDLLHTARYLKYPLFFCRNALFRG